MGYPKYDDDAATYRADLAQNEEGDYCDRATAAVSAMDLKPFVRPGQLNGLARLCHDLNHRWWRDPATGQPRERNVGEMIALMHSELSEALEAERKQLMDSHLPHRTGLEVELADLLIRVFDFAGARGLDLDGAVAEKLAYNARRTDHTDAARLAPGGKRY